MKCLINNLCQENLPNMKNETRRLKKCKVEANQNYFVQLSRNLVLISLLLIWDVAIERVGKITFVILFCKYYRYY